MDEKRELEQTICKIAAKNLELEERLKEAEERTALWRRLWRAHGQECGTHLRLSAGNGGERRGPWRFGRAARDAAKGLQKAKAITP